MEFSFDEQQLEFRAQLRAFAEKQCSVSDVRAAWSSELGWSRERWKALAQMGVVGMTVPERYGGLGLGFVDLVLLLEEAGRACLPEPLLETVALGVSGLADASGERAEELQLEWLPRVAIGDAVLTVGVSSSSSSRSASSVSLVHVAAAAGADLLLLEHRSGARRELHAVSSTDVHQRTLPSLDGASRVAEVTWEPSASTTVVSGERGEAVLAGIADRAATGAGAILLGAADRMITMAAEYALERRQFGKPIGSFQAVKHHLASALVRLEFARPLVYRSALSLDQGDPEASVHASMAKASASDAALLAARSALQVHGAIGYTWEHDLHLWMKRAWALAASWGDAAFHRSRVLESAVAARS